jgi:hypothetical protein
MYETLLIAIIIIMFLALYATDMIENLRPFERNFRGAFYTTISA